MNSAAGESVLLVDALGVVLEWARLERRLTREGVAVRAGLTPAALSLIELGTCEPTATEFMNLAVALGVSPGWLLDEALAWSGRPLAELSKPSRALRLIGLGRAAREAVRRCSLRQLTCNVPVGIVLSAELLKQGLTVTVIPRTRKAPASR